jgi:hypothetical protein
MLLEHVFPNWKRAELAEVFAVAVAGYALVGHMVFNLPEEAPVDITPRDCVVMTLEKN